MAGRDRRDRGRLLRRSTAGLVVLVLVAAGASYWFDLGPRWFGFDYPSPITQPGEVAPPPGLTLPSPKPAAAVAHPTPQVKASRAAVRRALHSLVRRKRLGRRVAVDVAQLADGRNVYRHGPSRVTPASTMKLLTTTAALSVLGPDHRFVTSVVAKPASRQVVLVGGGDPLLARVPHPSGRSYPLTANLRTLAKGTAQALKTSARTRVRLAYDTSLFSGPRVNPHWPANYIPDNVVSPISPLWVDEGLGPGGSVSRSHHPARAAARVFAQELGRHGIKVVGAIRRQRAKPKAERLASVQSAPLSQIVQHVLELSDNEGAEVLARQVAIKEGLPGSFRGAVHGIRAALKRLGIDVSRDRFFDGSGLSRRDRLAPATLLNVLETDAAAGHPDLRPVVVDLPVAGFTGSLSYRFETGNPAGPGVVRAKTGTLTGVHGLVGTVTTKDGAVLVFVAIADRVQPRYTLPARALLDDIAAALAGCRCAAPGGSVSATP